jgi:uncharacterized protein (UPF0264 family)
MTGMLASVNSLEEAMLVLAEKVDIIDLKEPALGALGALDVDLVKNIVASVQGKCPISATIGDLPMQPELIFNAVQAMSESGVDYIKIGFFASDNHVTVIEKLATLTSRIKLIAVLFADTQPDFGLIDSLITAGFKGIMLDTQYKAKGSLATILSKADIEQFVNYVKSKNAICGLAGSLRLEDIPILLPYQPDYLGFRGALCEQNQRVGQLDIRSVQTIKQTIAAFY